MRVVLSTCPPDQAERIARGLLSHGAACVNIVGPIRSLYTWKGEVCDDAESLLVIKAGADRISALEQALAGLHPYELPEWVVLDVDPSLTSRAYRLWVQAGGGV